MADIVHRVGIKAPIEKVYEAVSTLKGLAGWWTQEVNGVESVGGKIDFLFRTKGGEILGQMKMEVARLESPGFVLWRCLEGPPEWIGTQIEFRMSVQDGQTILLFGHRNWKETVEFTHHCSTKWAVFLLSLRDLVETGKGKPSPDDVKIDNWN